MLRIFLWNMLILVRKSDGCMSDTKEESSATSIYSIRQDVRSLSISSMVDAIRQAPMPSLHRGVSDLQKQAFTIGFARSNNRQHQINRRGLPISRSTICVTILPIVHVKQVGHWR